MNERASIFVATFVCVCEWAHRWIDGTAHTSSSEVEKFAFVIFIKINISEGNDIFSFAEFANIFNVVFHHFSRTIIVRS